MESELLVSRVSRLSAVEAEMWVYPGGAIKAMPKGVIGGPCIVFGGPADKHNDVFTAETDFDIFDRGSVRVLWEHNCDKGFLKGELTRATLRLTDKSVDAMAQLDMSNPKHVAIYQKAQQGKLWFSTGSVSHLVDRQKVGTMNVIKSWPLAEVSCTESPAEDRAVVYALKSMGLKRSVGELMKQGDRATQEEVLAAVAQYEATLAEMFIKNFEHNREQWKREVQEAERKRLARERGW